MFRVPCYKANILRRIGGSNDTSSMIGKPTKIFDWDKAALLKDGINRGAMRSFPKKEKPRLQLRALLRAKERGERVHVFDAVNKNRAHAERKRHGEVDVVAVTDRDALGGRHTERVGGVLVGRAMRF